MSESLTSILLVGSAICSDTAWVPCPECDCDDLLLWGQGLGNPRCVVGNNGTDDLTFALRNECGVPDKKVAMVNFGTVIFVIVCYMLMGFYLDKQTVRFDEDEQTAQDYSVVISNPPGDAIDPEEFRSFFAENCDGARVTVCTCAVANDLLIQTLVTRRKILRSIAESLPPRSSMKFLDLARLAAKTENERTLMQRFLALFVPGIPGKFEKLNALRVKVQGLAQLNYPVTNIFVTFETEKDQRNVLSALSVGSVHAKNNNASVLVDRKYLFRGKHVLNVREPPEPNTVCWQTLNVTFADRLKQKALAILATLVTIGLVAVIIWLVSDVSTLFAAYTISIANAAFPAFAKVLTDSESHAYESDKQTSLYFKIALFRWANTAVIITIVTPFISTLSSEKDGLITKIEALFFAELVTTNFIQLFDPLGHINRHVLAPRAKTQEAMNLFFQGEQIELAER